MWREIGISASIILYQDLVLVMLPFPHPLLQGDHLDQWDQFPSIGWQTLCVQLPVSKSAPSQGSPPCSKERRIITTPHKQTYAYFSPISHCFSNLAFNLETQTADIKTADNSGHLCTKYFSKVMLHTYTHTHTHKQIHLCISNLR